MRGTTRTTAKRYIGIAIIGIVALVIGFQTGIWYVFDYCGYQYTRPEHTEALTETPSSIVTPTELPSIETPPSIVTPTPPPPITIKPPPIVIQTAPSYSIEEVATQIHTLVNEERIKHRLSPLTLDPFLTNLAWLHSNSMAGNDYFSHERLPGESDFDVGQLPGTIRGENLALIPHKKFIPGEFLSLEEATQWAVDSWMESTGHRANILRSDFTTTGIGIAFYCSLTPTKTGYIYITQIFEGYLD